MQRFGFAPLLSLILPSVTPAQDGEAGRLQEITPRLTTAVRKGLHWLSRNQNRDGSYGNGAAPVATTALAGLAFLAGGHLTGRSPYGENVRRAVEYLMKHTGRNGYINEGQGLARGAGGSGMHGHGYAMLFLSQFYGLADGAGSIDMEKLKRNLTLAVRLSERSQTPDGGWNYQPQSTFDEGSVTITQVQALRAARNAGIHVSLETIQKAIGYVNKVTNANGLTRYSLRGGGGNTRPTLTAAAMCCMTYLGQYDNPKIPKGLDFLIKGFLPGRPPNHPSQAAWGQWWFFYGNYYATVAMYYAGGKYWARWWPALRATLIQSQSANGSWTNGESRNYGTAFGTALALITLQIPYRYLPIFQRAED